MFAGCFGKTPITDFEQIFTDTFSSTLPDGITQNQIFLSDTLSCTFFSNTTYPYDLSTCINKSYSVHVIGWISREGKYLTAEDLIQSCSTANWLDLNDCTGEFLVFLHDRQNNTLTVFRDHLGTIPFAYCFVNGNWFFAADHIRLFKSLFKESDISDAYFISTYLTYAKNYCETLNPKIKKLLPANSVMLYKDGFSELSNYWRTNPTNTVFKGSLPDAIKSAVDIIQKQLIHIVEKNDNIATHFSGGIDSSLLTSMLARISKDPQKIHAFSWSPDKAIFTDNHLLDERHKIKEHANALNINVDFCFSGKHEFENYMKEVCAANEYFYEQYVQKIALEKDSRVLVSGLGGDEFLGLPNIPLYRSSIINGDIGSFLRMRKEQDGIGLLSHIQNSLLSPIRNRPFYRLKTAHNISLYLRSFDNQAHVNKQTFANKNGYFDEMLDYLHLPGRMDDWFIQGSISGIRYTYPFLNRQLIELLYSLPDHFFYGREFPDRYFLKKLAKNYLPESIYKQSKLPDYQRETFFTDLQDTWLWEHKDQLTGFCEDHLNHLVACDELKKQITACQNKSEIRPFRGILFLTAKNQFLTTWLEKN